MRKPAPRDIGAGLMFSSLGIAGLWFARDLPAGTASFMEAGYMPRLVSWILLGLGAAITMRGLVREGPALTPWGGRPLAILTLAVLLFALLIDRLGLVISVAGMTMLLSQAGQRVLGWRQLAAFALALSAAAAALFHYGLGLPIPLWPWR